MLARNKFVYSVKYKDWAILIRKVASLQCQAQDCFTISSRKEPFTVLAWNKFVYSVKYKDWACHENESEIIFYFFIFWKDPTQLKPGQARASQKAHVERFNLEVCPYKTYYTCNSQLDQGIPKGKVSLYRWPPVWLVWYQLYANWQFLFLFAKLTNPNQSNRRSMVQWYFPLQYSLVWCNKVLLALVKFAIKYHQKWQRLYLPWLPWVM